MAERVKLWWDPGEGLTRRDRQGREYQAYLPDKLAQRRITLDSHVAADVSAAERAVARLNDEARALLDSEAIARLLLRAEAVASSRIEGLEVGARRLLKAQAAEGEGLSGRSADITSAEILNNIEAMRWALDEASGGPLTPPVILGIHKRLITGTRLDEYAGKTRTQQNWIGGNTSNPCSAEYVPPPADHVMPLLEDLCEFCRRDDLPALAKAAVAHAQFETIHPFADGNGRTGRALIHLLLKQDGLATVTIPPISLVLATWAGDYVAGLSGTRYDGSADTPEAHEGLNGWIELFASATIRAVADAEAYERRVDDLKAEWRARLGNPRSHSTALLLIEILPGAPLITLPSATRLTSRTPPAVNNALAKLLEAGILKQITIGRRNRAFEAPELLDAFNDLERQLASPGADTYSSPPVRRVPARRS
jgi:Fic family protein